MASRVVEEIYNKRKYNLEIISIKVHYLGGRANVKAILLWDSIKSRYPIQDSGIFFKDVKYSNIWRTC